LILLDLDHNPAKIISMPRKAAPRRPRRHYVGIAFILPSFLILLVVVILPILASLGISFTDFSVFDFGTWQGLDNYARLFSDPYFGEALQHTAVYTILAVPAQTLIALALAEVIAKRYRGAFGGFVRTAMFIPVIASLALAGVVWRVLLDTDKGAVNVILGLVGIPGPNWFGESTTALVAVVLVTVWKNVGFFLIIYYAGIMNISPDLYEASAIDGAGPIRQFWSITIPQLRPVTFLVVVLGTIWSFQVFDLVYTLTGGGPGGATTTLVMAIYKAGFRQFDMGYASAMAMVLLVIILLFSIVQRLLLTERKEKSS
jgi:multiple sugar transport system permease protein